MVGMISWLRTYLEYCGAIVVFRRSQLTPSFAAYLPLRLLKGCALKQILEVECELSSKEEQGFHV
jgi:hypothetical protein